MFWLHAVENAPCVFKVCGRFTQLPHEKLRHAETGRAEYFAHGMLLAVEILYYTATKC